MRKNWRCRVFPLFLFFCFLCFVGCKPKAPKGEVDYNRLKDPLIEANKKYLLKERDDIEAYVAAHGLVMTTTGTGLKYVLLKKGNGSAISTGDEVKIGYNVQLLNGTLCYSSEKQGPRVFRVGQDNVESGLHEAVCYLHQGDIAQIILPSHLAFGLVGDGHKIPTRSPVIYRIEVLAVRGR